MLNADMSWKVAPRLEWASDKVGFSANNFLKALDASANFWSCLYALPKLFQIIVEFGYFCRTCSQKSDNSKNFPSMVSSSRVAFIQSGSSSWARLKLLLSNYQSPVSVFRFYSVFCNLFKYEKNTVVLWINDLIPLFVINFKTCIKTLTGHALDD